MELSFKKQENKYIADIQSTFNNIVIYLKLKENDLINPTVSLYSSLNGIDFVFKDFIINPASREFEVEVGYSGILQGQILRIESNLEVLKSVIITQ